MLAEQEDSRYDLSKANFAQMRKHFENFDWSYLHEASIYQCWEIIKTRIHESMNGNIPKVKCNKDNRLIAVWMTGKIKKSMKKKYNLYNKFLNSSKSHDYLKYLLCRNQCNKIITRKERIQRKTIKGE